MRKIFAALAFALTSCASAPPPPPKAPSCVKGPPPNITGNKLGFLAPPKTIDHDKDVTLMLVNGESFVRFTEWVDALTQWADKTYDACRDPASPPASQVGSTVKRGPEQ